MVGCCEDDNEPSLVSSSLSQSVSQSVGRSVSKVSASNAEDIIRTKFRLGGYTCSCILRDFFVFVSRA